MCCGMICCVDLFKVCSDNYPSLPSYFNEAGPAGSMRTGLNPSAYTGVLMLSRCGGLVNSNWIVILKVQLEVLQITDKSKQ